MERAQAEAQRQVESAQATAKEAIIAATHAAREAAAADAKSQLEGLSVQLAAVEVGGAVSLALWFLSFFLSCLLSFFLSFFLSFLLSSFLAFFLAFLCWKRSEQAQSHEVRPTNLSHRSMARGIIIEWVLENLDVAP